MARCVNLDWLECHCLEPVNEPRDADFFRSLGYWVEERDYGTRVYEQMFTLRSFADDLPFIEVRRKPKSAGAVGIFQDNECHLRLVNRVCYFDNAASIMQDFIRMYNYEFRRISRVDICLDFETFDSGDVPQRFLDRYLKHRYAKINQCNIHAHGADRWDGQSWNSISWGSPASQIGTKMYNKTLELYDARTGTYGKPYIRQAWQKAGLVSDWHRMTKIAADGSVYTPDIWRVEFSIRSSVRSWFRIDVGDKRKWQSIRNTLDMYDSREKLLTLFASLSAHYFHFKHFTEGIRKDRCPDKQLFIWSDAQTVYKVGRESVAGDGKERSPYAALLNKLRAYRAAHADEQLRHACSVLIEALETDVYAYDNQHPLSRLEAVALRLLLQQNTSQMAEEQRLLLSDIKRFLKLNERTMPFV